MNPFLCPFCTDLSTKTYHIEKFCPYADKSTLIPLLQIFPAFFRPCVYMWQIEGNTVFRFTGGVRTRDDAAETDRPVICNLVKTVGDEAGFLEISHGWDGI
jgi:hypothetical protein